MKTEEITIEVTDKRVIKLLKQIQEIKTAFKAHVKKTGSSQDFNKKIDINK